jgi:hypothetical protein
MNDGLLIAFLVAVGFMAVYGKLDKIVDLLREIRDKRGQQ